MLWRIILFLTLAVCGSRVFAILENLSIHSYEVKNSTELEYSDEVQAKEKPKKTEKTPRPPAFEDMPINYGRLDVRVGRIVEIKLHPKAKNLYIEHIDVGEARPRVVCCGLKNFIPMERLMNRMVVVLCNIRPVKVRGVVSEAMLLVASTPLKAEILIPPPRSKCGTPVIAEDVLRRPDPELDPKMRIFETVCKDLEVNSFCRLTYLGFPLKVKGVKGYISSSTLHNVHIRSS